MNPANPETTETDPALFDVRDIPCRIKHSKILQRWSELPMGGHFVLVNDHDPVPLRFQLDAQFPGEFTWEYLVNGPDRCHVRIRRVAVTPAPVR
jgi:uncharacterized protein (DUF2249 family)